jgi:hypothetical protein
LGEPQPGQIPDNIFLSVQQQKLDADVVCNVGDILVRNGASETWGLADGTANEADSGIMQTRVDCDTTGLVAGEVAVEVLSAPSYIYAVAGGVLNPGDPVKLDGSGQKFVLFVQGTDDVRLNVGRFSRLSIDQAGNNPSVDTDIIILKLGVGA